MPIDKHNIAHYVIGAAALGIATFGTIHTPAHEAAIHQIERPSRFDWPSLGMEKTSALGDALKGMKPGKVTIYCSRPACHDFQLDLDDAFQIAGWDSDFQPLPVDSESDPGLFVGPPGEDAELLAAAIKKATSIEAEIVPINEAPNKPISGVGIIIGKAKKQ